jgi:hypothetical protein
LAKVNPIAGLTCDWLTPWISYSTGSSMVRILRVVSLRMVSAVASVVVLPRAGHHDHPVRQLQQASKLRLIGLREAELVNVEQSAILRQQADHRRFAVLRRHHGDAHIEV